MQAFYILPDALKERLSLETTVNFPSIPEVDLCTKVHSHISDAERSFTTDRLTKYNHSIFN